MKRPAPNSRILTEILGENESFIRHVHRGLIETPLNDFYRELNLDELLVFEGVSWELRRKNDRHFFELIDSHPIYDVFDYVFDRGFPILSRNKNISEQSQEDYHKLNPFGRNLRERLEHVTPEAVQSLREKLREPARSYVSRETYARAEDTRYMYNMGADKFFSKNKKTRVKAYLSRIAGILRTYPKDYVPPPEPPPAPNRVAYYPSLF